MTGREPGDGQLADLLGNITSHFPGGGVRRLLTDPVKRSSNSQFIKLQATSCEKRTQKAVASSAYINVSADVIDEGKSFVNYLTT